MPVEGGSEERGYPKKGSDDERPKAAWVCERAGEDGESVVPLLACREHYN